MGKTPPRKYAWPLPLPARRGKGMRSVRLALLLSRLLELAPEGVRDFVDTFLRGGRDELEIDLLLPKLRAESRVGLAHVGEIGLAHGDDLGALRELGIEA